MILGAAAQVAGPYFVKVALDEGIALSNVGVLKQAGLWYLAVASVHWVSTFARLNIMARTGHLAGAVAPGRRHLGRRAERRYPPRWAFGQR